MVIKVSRYLCFFVIAAFVSGCIQSSASIKSNKLNAYHADIKRLLVVTELERVLDDGPNSVFTTSFTNSLSQCGIVAEVHKHDPLSLQNDSLEAIKTFTPDTVMTLQWKSAASINRGPLNTVLMGSIVDLPTKRLVWKAEINFVSAWSGGETLAASIIDRLKTEAIISPSCPTPIVPKRGI